MNNTMVMLRNSMDDLPDEIMLKIFQYVDNKDLVGSVQHVSSHWKDIAHDRTLWKDYCYNPGRTAKSAEVAKFLEQSPRLKSFTMSSEMDPDLILDALCKRSKELRTLKIVVDRRLNIRILKGIFSRIPNLEYLQISQMVSIIPKNTFEKCLTLRLRSPSDNHLSPKLGYFYESLNSGNTYSCFIEVVKYILRRKREEIVSLRLNVITDEILSLVKECHGIEKLRLEFDQYQDNLKSNLEFIRKFPCLESLALVNFFNANLLNDLFSKGNLGKLVELDFSWCIDFTDEVAKSVRQCCPRLERLTLECCFKLTDRGVQELAKCSELSHLKMASCPLLGPDSVRHVAKCRKLVHLDLSSYKCDVDLFLGHLLTARQVQVLVLKGCALTNDHVHSILVNLRRLTHLGVDVSKRMDERVYWMLTRT